MLRVYSVILSLHEEPKQLFSVCSLFANILSSKSFWKERQEREGLPFVLVQGPSLLRAYYLTREFVKRSSFSCHLSELPFFPSFAQGEEYYARAIKFRRERVPEDVNSEVFRACVYTDESTGTTCVSYNKNKDRVDRKIRNYEKALGIRDLDHPSLDVSARLYKESLHGFYYFQLYLGLREQRVDVPLQSTPIKPEEALSFYLQVRK
jgi:hypothetical protein